MSIILGVFVLLFFLAMYRVVLVFEMTLVGFYTYEDLVHLHLIFQ